MTPMTPMCPHAELTLIRNEESRKIALVQCEDCGDFVAYGKQRQIEIEREDWAQHESDKEDALARGDY